MARSTKDRPPSGQTDSKDITNQAALLAAINASSLWKLDCTLSELLKMKLRELRTQEADFGRVCTEHLERRRDDEFQLNLSYARRECAAAGLSFDTFAPALEDANKLYFELWRFSTAPQPPELDPHKQINEDKTLIQPERYLELNSAHTSAHEGLQQLQFRLNLIICKLVAFRDTVVGILLRDECLTQVGTPEAPPDPYMDLRQFARSNLKGKQRAVIEALCDANGEMLIPNLAVKDGVSWDDPFQGYKDVQRQINSKIKSLGWRIERLNNAARVVKLKE